MHGAQIKQQILKQLWHYPPTTKNHVIYRAKSKRSRQDIHHFSMDRRGGRHIPISGGLLNSVCWLTQLTHKHAGSVIQSDQT